jgi:hypothetical protein
MINSSTVINLTNYCLSKIDQVEAEFISCSDGVMFFREFNDLLNDDAWRNTACTKVP